jgi:hypothetical protein
MRGYRLHGRVARPSRVFIGQYKGAAAEAGASAEAAPLEELAATEVAAEAAAVAEALPDTVPIDEATMRELFGTGGGEEPEEK